MNSDKSEVALFGTRQGLRQSNIPASVNIAASNVAVSDTLKILGVTLDVLLTYSNHINTVVRACNYHIRALCHLCPCLSLDVAKTMAASIVGLQIDYCNALLYGAGQSVFSKLQRVQNNLEHVICNVGRRLHTQLICCVTSTGYQSVIV